MKHFVPWLPLSHLSHFQVWGIALSTVAFVAFSPMVLQLTEPGCLIPKIPRLSPWESNLNRPVEPFRTVSYFSQ
ncbi:MAG: hypothetical protein VE99_C0001G0341 [candidate division Kazan bacterium GW2011_GWC1_52_13]|uniref:Uncharacterized protein n=1 Tax=candidate division Kazan bacterium GW2011_GWB1_52_7 TaxID=1620414 RepID=A0A0G1X7W9_UNCK3|nr:MAG: hypothetical protein VE99_C0001G0341 [candidate division Kazan bacterium GW2011_GWC1_52_13]KKW27283.1 MAG: hypothetical protein VF00_C0001G0218 [candidate division Kazan bacterium GW2011_GWB1_52_7]